MYFKVRSKENPKTIPFDPRLITLQSLSRKRFENRKENIDARRFRELFRLIESNWYPLRESGATVGHMSNSYSWRCAAEARARFLTLLSPGAIALVVLWLPFVHIGFFESFRFGIFFVTVFNVYCSFYMIGNSCFYNVSWSTF